MENLNEKFKRLAEHIRYLVDRARFGRARARRNKCSRAYPGMIFKQVKEFHVAYLNCLRTSPMSNHPFTMWTPRDQGNWWREQHRVFPQADGTYGFLSEQEYFWFVLRWS